MPSSQTTLASPVNQTLTIVGTGLANATARLDGTPLTPVSVSDRVMIVTVPAAMQASPTALHARRDGQRNAAVSNAKSFAVDLERGPDQHQLPDSLAGRRGHRSPAQCCRVTEPGCTPGIVAIINLPGGAESSGYGAHGRPWEPPHRRGICPTAGLAVVANQGSNNANNHRRGQWRA